MDPKEKAEELFRKFVYAVRYEGTIDEDGFMTNINHAKESALIAVNEIMEYLDVILLPNPFAQYWQEVKQEIEKL